MKMKRAICVLFALTLMIGVAGCGRGNDDNNSSEPQGQDEISLGGAEAGNSIDENQLGDETETLGSGAEFGDENVRIDVQLGKEGYTLQERVEIEVTVTNIADTPIVYVHGSGSNTIPDALHIALDNLSALFRPFQMTMDYGVHTLQPGESVTFEAPFAPYTAHSEDTVVHRDFDFDLFRNEDEFAPAEHREYEGTIRFTYYLSETEEVDAAIDLVDNQDGITIEGSFRTNIIEDDETMGGDQSGTALTDGERDNEDGHYEDDDGILDDAE